MTSTGIATRQIIFIFTVFSRIYQKDIWNVEKCTEFSNVIEGLTTRLTRMIKRTGNELQHLYSLFQLVEGFRRIPKGPMAILKVESDEIVTRYVPSCLTFLFRKESFKHLFITYRIQKICFLSNILYRCIEIYFCILLYYFFYQY